MAANSVKSKPKTRDRRKLETRLIMAGVGTLGLIAAHILKDQYYLLSRTILVVTLLIIIALSFRLNKLFDEFARTGQYFSWYWGSCIGLGLSIPILFIERFNDNAISRKLGLTPEQWDIYTDGAVSLILLQILGVLIAFGFWFFRNR